MKCTRVYLPPVGLPNAEGNYGQDERGEWWFRAPNTRSMAALTDHEVEVHEDGTISVTPSILWPKGMNGAEVEVHGYLTRGEWREA